MFHASLSHWGSTSSALSMPTAKSQAESSLWALLSREELAPSFPVPTPGDRWAQQKSFLQKLPARGQARAWKMFTEHDMNYQRIVNNLNIHEQGNGWTKWDRLCYQIPCSHLIKKAESRPFIYSTDAFSVRPTVLSGGHATVSSNKPQLGLPGGLGSDSNEIVVPTVQHRDLQRAMKTTQTEKSGRASRRKWQWSQDQDKWERTGRVCANVLWQKIPWPGEGQKGVVGAGTEGLW